MRLALSFTAVTFVVFAALAQESAPLPLDPLRPAERDAAVRIAQASPRVRELLDQNSRLVTVYSMGIKRAGGDGEPRGRNAIVLWIRADNNAGVQALVDLSAGAMVDVVRIPPQSVPLGLADVELALRIFTQTLEARGLLGERLTTFHVLTGPVTRESANGDIVQGLQTIGGGGDDVCRRHRCVALFFESGGRAMLAGRTIVVDLNDQRATITTTTVTKKEMH